MFSRRPGKPHTRSRLCLMLEELESRTLLSASSLDAMVATPQAVTTSDAQTSASLDPQRQSGGGGSSITNKTVVGYTPSQIQTAYGFSNNGTYNNNISFVNSSGQTVKGDGTGQTIAIVDAYNDPNIMSDANTFSSHFGLPQFNSAGGPKLTVVNQNGGTRLPMTSSSWSGEISLDVEWAHAIAPGANIVLVEANSNSLSNLLTAVNYAATKTGASVVSMSWGGSEFSSETAYDSYFNHPGVTFVASSGDQGAPTSWPAVSPNVLAVGGTTLTQNPDGTYSETGWSDSGGGISVYESKPTYQSKVTQSSTNRSNPDVAYNADPNTGFAIYDTVPYSRQTGWFEVGGTSAGAPQWAALIAIANQGRALNSTNNTPLSGVSQTLPALYNMSASDFHDITSNTNNTGTPYLAGSGYDLVTGRGTPYANLVVQALVGALSTGDVGSLAVTSSSKTSHPRPATHAFTLAMPADPTSGSSSVAGTISLASSALPTTTMTAAVLIPSAQTVGSSSFAFDAAAVSTLGFGSFQTTAAANTNTGSQAQAAIPSFPFSALGLNSAFNGSSARGNSLLTPFLSPSADGVMMIGPGLADDVGSDGVPVPRQAIRVPGHGTIDLERIPGIPAEEGDEAAPACDACFMDEASMIAVAEQTLALASGDNEASSAFHGSGLALLGVLASSLWMAPDRAEETQKRRRNILWPSR